MKWAFYFLCAAVSIISISCSEDFDAKTGIESKYVLYGVYNAVQNIPKQSRIGFLKEIKLSRVYNVDQYDLSSFSVEPVVNATVMAYGKGRPVQCTEEFSRKEQEKSYKVYGDFFAGPDDDITVTATMPNKDRLSATTRLLKYNYITRDYPFYSGFTSKINHFLWGSSFNLFWDSNRNPNLFFFSLSVQYSEMTDSGEVFKTKEIPFKVLKKGNKYEPVYPSYQFEKQISYDYEAIDYAITEIAAGKPDKSKFKLYWLNLKLLEFNSDLTKYFSSIHGFTDRFSIRLDEAVYSNVSGGIGVLGATTQVIDVLYFHPDYPGIFGYQAFLDW